MRRPSPLLLTAASLCLACTEVPTASDLPSLTLAASPASGATARGTAGSCNLDLTQSPFDRKGRMWERTSSSVTTLDGTLTIYPAGDVDDGFAAPCRLAGFWSLEVTARIVSGGANYVFPKVHGQFSNGWWFMTTSLPDGQHGWLLMACDPQSWLEDDLIPGHTAPEICNEDRWSLTPAPSVNEGEFLTLRITSDGDHLKVYSKPAGEASFALAREIPFATTGLIVTRVGVSQPWDAHVEVMSMEATRSGPP